MSKEAVMAYFWVLFELSPGGTEIIMKTLRIIGVLPEICKGHLLCAGQKHPAYANLFDI
jgi:hypothetical protein